MLSSKFLQQTSDSNFGVKDFLRVMHASEKDAKLVQAAKPDAKSNLQSAKDVPVSFPILALGVLCVSFFHPADRYCIV